MSPGRPSSACPARSRGPACTRQHSGLGSRRSSATAGGLVRPVRARPRRRVRRRLDRRAGGVASVTLDEECLQPARGHSRRRSGRGAPRRRRAGSARRRGSRGTWLARAPGSAARASTASLPSPRGSIGTPTAPCSAATPTRCVGEVPAGTRTALRGSCASALSVFARRARLSRSAVVQSGRPFGVADLRRRLASEQVLARQPDRLRGPRPVRRALPGAHPARRLGLPDHRARAGPFRPRTSRAASRRRLPDAGPRAHTRKEIERCRELSRARLRRGRQLGTNAGRQLSEPAIDRVELPLKRVELVVDRGWLGSCTCGICSRG